jgi:uncharacterized coiled-coil DUF342 family protein
LAAFAEDVGGQGMKNIETAMYASLPDIAKMEGAIRLGHVAQEYSIADDLSMVVDVYVRLKQEGKSVVDYLAQQSFAAELSPFQMQLLRAINENTRSQKNLRQLFKEYARRVMDQPPPNQLSMFEVKKYTKGELLDAAYKEITKSVDEAPLFSGLDEAATAPLAAQGDELAESVSRGAGTGAEDLARVPTEEAGEVGEAAVDLTEEALGGAGKAIEPEPGIERAAEAVTEAPVEKAAGAVPDAVFDEYQKNVRGYATSAEQSAQSLRLPERQAKIVELRKKTDEKLSAMRGTATVDDMEAAYQEFLDELYAINQTAQKGSQADIRVRAAIEKAREAPAPEAVTPTPAPAPKPKERIKGIPDEVTGAYEEAKKARDELAKARRTYKGASKEERDANLLAEKVKRAQAKAQKAEKSFKKTLLENNLTRDEFDELMERGIPDNALIPPVNPNPEVTPSATRAQLEQLEEYKKLFNRLKKSLDENWGRTEAVAKSPELKAALGKWSKEAKKRIAETRLMASTVANATRDFTLLNYTDKRYFDLALAYIFPYHFWYTRTYANWMQRLAFNPKIVSGYAQYKEMLAKIHAGAPDWWKYTINTNELLGLDMEHPLYANLEATLNPMHGLTGVDFNDPEMRVDWWTNTLADLSKFGPSTWTPFSIGMAVSLWMRGEKEAASRWGSRLIPQTAAIKSISALANIGPQGGLELDPNVWFFSDGLDPYERRRVGRALGTLMEQGISETDIIEAAHSQKGEIWEMAKDLAAKARAPGQLSSFLLGVGFKARSETDLQIDKFYQDHRYLWAMEPMLTAEELQQGMDQLFQRYPFGNAILLSRKSGLARDRSFAYNVLGRIGPGQKNDVAEAVGIDPRLLSKFYEEKGHIENWTETDRQKFMAGIADIGALLAIPGDATRAEWNQASRTYSKMLKEGQERYGKDIEDLVGMYYSAKGDTQQARDAANAILEKYPQVGEYLDWRTMMVVATPILSTYYGGIGTLENYYNGLFYSKVEEELGKDLWDVIDEYYLLKNSGGDYKAFTKSHPQLKKYWSMKEQHQQMLTGLLAQAGGLVKERKQMELRPGAVAGATSLGEQDLANLVGAEEGPLIPWEEWQQILPEPLSDVIYLASRRGQPFPEAALTQLYDMAEEMGVDPDYLLDEIQKSLDEL